MSLWQQNVMSDNNYFFQKVTSSSKYPKLFCTMGLVKIDNDKLKMGSYLAHAYRHGLGIMNPGMQCIADCNIHIQSTHSLPWDSYSGQPLPSTLVYWFDRQCLWCLVDKFLGLHQVVAPLMELVHSKTDSANWKYQTYECVSQACLLKSRTGISRSQISWLWSKGLKQLYVRWLKKLVCSALASSYTVLGLNVPSAMKASYRNTFNHTRTWGVRAS